MPSRKLLNGVLRGFLGTYVSRYSDLDGYLVFGLAADALDGLEVDLTLDAPAPSLDPVSEVRRLAIRRFSEQLAKVGLSRSVVRSATLAIRPAPEARGGYVETGRRVPSGHDYTFTVSVVTDLGRPYRAECRAFIAPHAPDVFLRSARRGFVGADDEPSPR
jgi:hypothetical protein